MRCRFSTPILKSKRGAILALALCVSLVLAGGQGASAEKSLTSPYFGASFTVKRNSYAFGQAASWTPTTRSSRDSSTVPG